MRYSKQRELVLQKVEQLCDHPTAEEIYDEAIKECPGRADRFDHTLCWHSHMYCTVCGGVVDADVDEKQVMKLVKNQKGAVQDCAVVLFGVCEECLKKQAAQ